MASWSLVIGVANTRCLPDARRTTITVRLSEFFFMSALRQLGPSRVISGGSITLIIYI